MNKVYPYLRFIILGFAAIIYFFGADFFTQLDSSSIGIDSYSAEITINENGDMNVVETWDMNYQDSLRVRFRDIEFKKYGTGYPLPKSSTNTATFDETNVSVIVKKNNVDVTNQVEVGYSFAHDYDELGELVTCDPVSSTCESIFVDLLGAGGLSGDVTFIYDYTILGAITEYSDISELNWRLFEYVEGTVKTANVTVNLPTNAHPKADIMAWGHGLSTGTISIPTNNRIEMEMTNIKMGEFIEFRILAPTDLFPSVAAKNTFIDSGINLAILEAYEAQLADETNLRILVAQIVLGIAIGVAVLMGIVTFFVYRKYDKEYTPVFQGEYYRELPNSDTPAEMSYLYYMKKINDEDLTATLLDLIRKKFVSIDYSGQDLTSKDADFTLQLEPGTDQSNLLAHEKQVIHWFFEVIGNGKTVSTETIEKYGKKGINQANKFQEEARLFVRLAKAEGAKHDYFEGGITGESKKALIYVAIPLLTLVAALITASWFSIDNLMAILILAFVAIAYIVYVSTIKKRSVNGNELYTKWKAFKNFLVNFGNMKDYPIPGVAVWEHYLVYATSLKVADKVMDQLKVKLPTEDLESSDSTYLGMGYRARGFYFGYFLGRFQGSLSTARTNSIQTITAYNAARAGRSGHGGGFGGGSSFGGGGGGGRSR